SIDTPYCIGILAHHAGSRNHDKEGAVKGLSRRLAVVAVAAVSAAAIAVGCGSDDEADKASAGGGGASGGGSIPIGLVTDVSGPFVTVGKDVEAAVKLAVEEINADGGVNGAQLDLTMIDTGG